MITLSAAFQTAVSAGRKEPRFAIEISGLNNSQGTALVFATGPIANSGKDVRTLLRIPQSQSSNLDLEAMRATYSGLDFEIVDRDNILTSRLDDFDFRGKTVTLKVGFAEIAFSDYATVFAGLITNYSQLEDARSYLFNSTDLQINLDKFIFILAKTKLSAALSAIDDTIPVDSTADFSTAGPFVEHEDQTLARGHILIGSGATAELIEWTAKDGTNFTTVIRAFLGTARTAFAIGTEVSEVVVWPGHPLEILSVMLSGATIEEAAAYANVPSTWKIDPALAIDATSWLAAKDRTRSVIHSYRTKTSQFVRNFADLEILQPLRLFLRATAANALGLVSAIERPNPTSLARSLDKGKVGRIAGWDSRVDIVANQAVVLYDFSLATGSYATQKTSNDAASQAKYGITGTRTLSLKGLRTELGGEDLAELIGLEQFVIQGDARPEVELPALSRQLDLEIGDSVRLTHPDLPSIPAGVRGESDRFMKVIGRELGFGNLQSDLSLYDAAIPTSNKYATVAADGTPDFGAATPTQQTELVFLDRSFRPA